jgi:hypothetical protein
MKHLLVQILMACTVCLSLQATAAQRDKTDVRAEPDFIATCPEKYLTYYDKSEGGPGPYCACPDEKMSYIDKVEGGPGLYCAE